ncbi:hypothetical protein FACS1894196_0440 [Clostridia bacterium]|nr:hypothetical protein FACS1894196_0440 [Clostridia bacterium]
MQKKKISAGSILIFLAMLGIGFAVGGVIGIFVGRLARLGVWYGVLALVLFYLAVILQIVVHEAGHMIFGLLTGYRFVSFRVLSLMLIREEGKFKCKRFKLAGTGGQCLMAPPDLKDGKIPVMLYNFGGALLNLLVSALTFALYLLRRDAPLSGGFLFIFSLVGVAYALMNGIPMKMGLVSNDGKNAVSLGGDSGAIRAWWIQLKVNEMTARGVRLREMPEAWFALPGEEELRNPITAAIAVLACSRAMDARDFTAAKAIADKLLSGAYAVANLHRSLLALELIFIELVGEGRQEVIESYRTKQLRSYTRAMQNNPSVIRVAFAQALRQGDAQEAEKKLALFEKVARSYPYPSDIASEAELIAYAREQAGQRNEKGERV